jgi:hypothetical protein
MIRPIAFLILLSVLLPGRLAWGQANHTLIRRVTVVPIKAPQELQAVAEEAWGGLREGMT